MSDLRWPSITRGPRGTFVVVAGPTALMRLPAMITVRSEELAAAPSSSGCTTVAPTMAVRVPPAGLAARGSASDTVAAAPQSAAASTVWQQRNRDMAVLSRITLPPTVAPARPGARGFFRHLARVPFRHVSVNSDRKSTRLNSSHLVISYAVFCLKKKNITLRLLIRKVRRKVIFEPRCHRQHYGSYAE